MAQTTSPPAGSIVMSTVSMLSNPRPIDAQKGTRNILLDANVYCEDHHRQTTLGVVRYFIPDAMINYQFSTEDFTPAFITATITTISETFPNVYLSSDGEFKVSDYAFMGDIIDLTIAHSDISKKKHPIITMTGTVKQCDMHAHTFVIAASQYNAIIHGLAPMSLECYIPEDSKRWPTNRKPKPTVNSAITVTGLLQQIKRTATKSISAFQVQLVSFTYINRSTAFDSTSSTADTSVAHTHAHTLFNYDATPPLETVPVQDNSAAPLNVVSSPDPPTKRSHDEDGDSLNNEKEGKPSAAKKKKKE
ncbi:hypothetical protein BDZ97DRAFT_1792117 [Flammula alnicola]|nr:hypothetical protein BDZ97DRAFT_1792117 [Flammula alnicola]